MRLYFSSHKVLWPLFLLMSTNQSLSWLSIQISERSCTATLPKIRKVFTYRVRWQKIYSRKKTLRPRIQATSIKAPLILTIPWYLNFDMTWRKRSPYLTLKICKITFIISFTLEIWIRNDRISKKKILFQMQSLFKGLHITLDHPLFAFYIFMSYRIDLSKKLLIYYNKKERKKFIFTSTHNFGLTRELNPFHYGWSC